MLPNIARDEAQRPSLFGPSLEEALGPGLVLTSEDLDAEVLLNQLRRLIPAQGRALGPLDADQVDEIRSVLHPEVRIGWGATSDEIVGVMDREQERLAQTLGDGHRLLRGVAGSGKTIVLVCRVRYLRARHPDWRVLVLCFNRVLADAFRAPLLMTKSRCRPFTPGAPGSSKQPALQAGSGQVDRGECGLGSNQRRPRYSEGVAPVHRRNARLKALTSE